MALLERNHLAGAASDAVNAILVAAEHNMRLLIAYLTALWRFLITAWLSALPPQLLTGLAFSRLIRRQRSCRRRGHGWRRARIAPIGARCR